MLFVHLPELYKRNHRKTYTKCYVPTFQQIELSRQHDAQILELS